jgi:hypothetical protein
LLLSFLLLWVLQTVRNLSVLFLDSTCDYLSSPGWIYEHSVPDGDNWSAWLLMNVWKSNTHVESHAWLDSCVVFSGNEQ